MVTEKRSVELSGKDFYDDVYMRCMEYYRWSKKASDEHWKGFHIATAKYVIPDPATVEDLYRAMTEPPSLWWRFKRFLRKLKF